MLDLKRLRVLRAVGEQGSFSAAAEELFVSQSAVSQRAAAAGIAEGRRARELVQFLTRTALEGHR